MHQTHNLATWVRIPDGKLSTDAIQPFLLFLFFLLETVRDGTNTPFFGDGAALFMEKYFFQELHVHVYNILMSMQMYYSLF